MNKEIFTIGHSTHCAEEFIKLVKAYHVSALVDVRTIPKSLRNPEFNKETFFAMLRKEGIKYFHLKGLGGFRHKLKNSLNKSWRNDSFRGYADYMQTQDFTNSLNELIDLANNENVVIMCAEALPWRCHRSLIADALMVRGITVNHIMSLSKSNKHIMTSFAVVKDTDITYP